MVKIAHGHIHSVHKATNKHLALNMLFTVVSYVYLINPSMCIYLLVCIGLTWIQLLTVNEVLPFAVPCLCSSEWISQQHLLNKHHIKMHNLLCLVLFLKCLLVCMCGLYICILCKWWKNTKVQPFKLKLSDFLFVKKVLKFMLKMTIIKFKSE